MCDWEFVKTILIEVSIPTQNPLGATQHCVDRQQDGKPYSRSPAHIASRKSLRGQTSMPWLPPRVSRSLPR